MLILSPGFSLILPKAIFPSVTDLEVKVADAKVG